MTAETNRAETGPAETGPTAAVTTLPELPGLPGLYARGVAASGRIAAGRIAAERGIPGARERALGLPDVTLRVAGVRTNGDDVVRRLTAYQRLLREPGSDLLPAGFLHVLGFPLTTALLVRDDFPFPLLGLIHVANSASLIQPVRLGDSLVLLAHARGLRAHRRGAQLEVVLEVLIQRAKGARGRGLSATTLAYRGVSTYLARGVTLPDGAAAGNGSTMAAGGSSAAGGSGAVVGSHRFAPPQPTARWALAANVGRAYAAVSGDRNPIHLSVLGAKAFGFPRAIAHGMYTAARALAEVGRARGDRYDWTVDFAGPVLLPGSVNVAILPAVDAPWREREPGEPAPPGAIAYAGWSRDGRPHFTGTVCPR